MQVFVTGGSGFVGGHLIEALVRHGHQVSALVRSDHSAKIVALYGAAPVLGSLDTVNAKMLGNAQTVIHAAAVTDEWGTREHFWQGNVIGTSNILNAACEAGAARFIHVGTEAAFFTGQDLNNIDELAPFPGHHRYLYAETKAAAEQRVLAANTASFATLSIRPRLVWGPCDATVLPAILRMAKQGKFSWINQGVARTSTTHVANAVHALVLALTHGKGGQAYFVADDGERSIRSFLSALALTQGQDLGKRSTPTIVARSAAAAVEGVYRIFKLKGVPPMTRFAIDMLSSNVTVNTARAKADLGYAPVITVDEGLLQLSRRG